MEISLSKLKEITTFILDVDGVLTDGTVLVNEEGHMLRSMNIKDGFALQHAIKQGFKVIIITGGSSQGVIKRLQGLGITNIYHGIHDKLSKFHEVIKDLGLSKNECLYMGDDLPDFPVLMECGFKSCPADAVHQLKEKVDYISPAKGGHGCVRDVIEKTLTLQDKWMNEDSFHW